MKQVTTQQLIAAKAEAHFDGLSAAEREVVAEEMFNILRDQIDFSSTPIADVSADLIKTGYAMAAALGDDADLRIRQFLSPRTTL